MLGRGGGRRQRTILTGDCEAGGAALNDPVPVLGATAVQSAVLTSRILHGPQEEERSVRQLDGVVALGGDGAAVLAQPGDGGLGAAGGHAVKGGGRPARDRQVHRVFGNFWRGR